jgi:hypothetical protein
MCRRVFAVMVARDRNEGSTEEGRREAVDARLRPPVVSIIIPVLNAAPVIENCLRAVLNQTHERERCEVIVVDNGSTDRTRDVVQAYPVRLLEETAWRSPYAARNAGIAQARGELLAFTDADCTPEPGWLRGAVEALEDEGADLLGGKVVFTFSPTASLGELTDALWHLDVRRQIETNRACMTANLVVRKEVFSAVGPFDARVRSGGDGRWTRRATDAGFKLVYGPSAEVKKPARRMVPLLRKAHRVGRGLPAAWVERGLGRGGIGAGIVRLLIPPSPSAVKQRIRDRSYQEMAGRNLQLWWSTWLLEMFRATGCLRGWLEMAGQWSSGHAEVGDDG